MQASSTAEYASECIRLPQFREPICAIRFKDTEKKASLAEEQDVMPKVVLPASFPGECEHEVTAELFCTYGDARYARSRERLAHEASRSGLFNSIHIYTLSDALDLARGSEQTLQVLHQAEQALKGPGRKCRGGGYWLWKPLVLQAALASVEDGDVVVYADAGCSMASRGEAMSASGRKECTDKISALRSGQPLDACRLPRSRKHGRFVYGNERYCRLACARMFAIDFDGFMSTVQVEANRVMLLKNAESTAFVEQWAAAALQHPDLFMDAPAGEVNSAGFREHRHDQAVFSALLHNRAWQGSDWSFITADRIRG
eukprot:gnl/TRDRNA2_/TRDRNA2_58530_c0_seq1.p1 gnl/TRDRNA2_/TRDRNA2_58530_c0~~gnl/TRDRNA2_/TRDRNA2_58530_c0_seq1.p1  ORF type:complete len:315 (+),score=49.08 gnl/TRDRNA2_/TRDRNA2_58530_c0_seq1:91-1035(+)